MSDLPKIQKLDYSRFLAVGQRTKLLREKINELIDECDRLRADNKFLHNRLNKIRDKKPL